MKLPIFYIGFLKSHLDLSSLLEVGDAEFIDRMGCDGWFVGFKYSMVGNPNPLVFQRGLSRAKGWGAEFDSTVYEMGWDAEKKQHILTMSGDEPLCVVNLRAEMQELLTAWSKWKQIEPEIYRLIKEKM